MSLLACGNRLASLVSLALCEHHPSLSPSSHGLSLCVSVCLSFSPSEGHLSLDSGPILIREDVISRSLSYE